MKTSPVLAGRLTGKNIIHDAFGLVVWALFTLLFLSFLSIVFYTLAPTHLPVISNNVAVWTGSFAVPSLVLLAAIHLTAPAISIRGYKWNYIRIYAMLTFLVALYALVLNLSLTNPIGSGLLLIVAIVLQYAYPAIRLSSTRTSRRAIAVLATLAVLVIPNATSTRVNAALADLSSRSSVISSNSIDARVVGERRRVPKPS
jgi:hypothetical protein